MDNFLKPTAVNTSDLPPVYMNLFSNNGQNFKMISKWNDTSIQFYVVDNNNNIFTANVTRQTFVPQADKLKLKLNDYLNELESIFNKNEQNYIFSMGDNHFLIKRVLNEEDEMYEKFCDLNLSKANSNDIIFDLWDLMLKVYYYHKNDNDLHREQFEVLKKAHQRSISKLEEMQTIWENEKKDLKLKFLLLLNEKKDRILELRDLLEDSMQTRSNDSVKRSSKQTTKRKSEKCEISSPESMKGNSSPLKWNEDSNESFTDETRLVTLQSFSTTTISEPQPSTSKLTTFEISTRTNNQTKIACSEESDSSENLLGESQEPPIIEVKRNRREEKVDSKITLTLNQPQNDSTEMKDDILEKNDDMVESSFNLDEYLAQMRQ